MNPLDWAVRYRFRVDKPFNIDASQIDVTINGRLGTLKARDEGSLKNTNWIVLRFDGFDCEEVANAFAATLTDQLLLAAVKNQMGIDLGKNEPTVRFSKEYLRAIYGGSDIVPLEDVHGVMVFKRTGRERFPFFSATAVVHQPLDKFADAINAEVGATLRTHTLRAACELVALSMMSPDHLAKGTMCMSAIELLAHKPWADDQVTLLRRLKEQAEKANDLPPEKAAEVARAMDNVFKSIRQGLKRLVLDDLKMGEQAWAELDDLYGLRSAIFHGKTGFDAQQNIDFGSRAVKVASAILAAAAASH